MRGFDLADARLDRKIVEQETRRIFEVCDGCRRCLNLCPSFNTLLDRIDTVESDIDKLIPVDTRQVVDECYYCKLCYNHCPYTPPHQFEIDFPRLMFAWKRIYAQERTPSLRDRLLVRTEWNGKIGSWVAPLANWAMGNRVIRRLMQAFMGVHHDRAVVRFHSETFPRWWARRSPAVSTSVPSEPVARVALFSSCTVDYHCPGIGRAVVQVLEKNGIEVVRPEAQQCCGMPYVENGDLASIRAKAESNLAVLDPWIARGYDVIAPVPSCSLMLKREYPDFLNTDRAKRVAERTFDICEYLMKLHRQGKLDTDFVWTPGRIAYHVPCHLRDQNIGFKSKELLELTGARVEAIERCSGHDGTWGVKQEFFQLSMKIAGKLTRQIEEVKPDLVVTDCPLAGVQIDQAAARPSSTLHPIQIVARAYGLPQD